MSSHTRFYDQLKLEGNSVLLGYGSYTTSQLNSLLNPILSISIPAHVKVTIYSANNFLGTNYVMSNANNKSLKIPSFVKEFPFTIASLTIECACDLPDTSSVTYNITNATTIRNNQVIGYTFYNVIPVPQMYPDAKPSPYNSTIFIIGDFGVNSTIYSCMQEFFAQRRLSSVFVDPRGVGMSASSLSNTYADVLQDYRYVGTLLGQFKKKPIVIGHGFGGIIAQLWALTYKFELRNMILINSAPYSVYNSFNLISSVFTSWLDNTITTNQFAMDISTSTYNTPSNECQPEVLQLDLQNSINTANTSTMKLFLTQNPDNSALAQAPKFILIPTLILAGLQDIYTNITGSLQLYQLIKKSTYIKLNTSHAPQFTESNKTYDIIYRFISPKGSLYLLPDARV
jgi:pimeloyl-ACP methyl ester carboxylesterase